MHGDVCSGLEKLIDDTDGKGQLKPGAKPGVQPHGTAGSGGSSSGGGDGGRRSGASGFFIFFILLVVIGGVFGVWYQFLASAAAKAQVEDLAVGAKAFGVSLVGLVADKVSACFGRTGGGFGMGLGARTPAVPRYQPLDEELNNYFQPLPAAGAAEAGELHAPIGNGNGVYTIR